MRKIAALAFVLLAISGVSFSLTTVSSCMVISSSDLYVLNQTVAGGPTCIYINASNVDLNCAGFGVVNNASPSGTTGVHIDGPVSNVTVRNCDVSGYQNGVQVESVTGGNFTGNHVFNNTNIAFFISGGSGNAFSDNFAENNAADGFNLASTSGNTFEDNIANGNNNGFFVASSADGNTFNGNNVSNGTNNGFDIGSDNNSLTGNIAHDFVLGFSFFNCVGNVLTANEAYDNSVGGFFLVSNANNNVLTDNIGHDHANHAFIIQSSTGNNLTGNQAYLNGNGFSISSSANDNNLVDNAAFNNTNGFLVSVSNGTNFDSNQAYNNSAGFRIITAAFTTMTGNLAANNSGNGFWLETATNSTLDSNIATGNKDDGFFLSVSIFGSPGGNILTGNTASGNGDAGFDNGIELSFSQGNTLSGNTVTNNFFDGIFLSLSNNNLVDGNVVVGGNRGIMMFSGSTNNTVSGNNISGASSNAIFTGDGNTFTDNIVTSSFEGISIGANNVLTGNSVSGIAAFECFRMESLSPNNVLADNTAFSSGRGLGIYHANNTTVTNMHFYNLSDFDMSTTTSTGDITLALTGLVFDGPAGTFTDFTNLTILDILENGTDYTIEHSANPGSTPSASHVSFANKFVTISSFNPTSIDSISWSWDDSELTSFNENNFELWKLDGSNWTLQNDTPDTAANTLSLTDLNNFSVFGIFDTATDITDCQNITTPGNYVLANDLFGAPINGSPSFTGFACIRISVSDVLLDCKGFSITDNTSVVSAGILTHAPSGAVDNVAVQNCVVSNYSQGIVAINTDDSSFTNNTVFSNSFDGISARDGSTGNAFSSNTVSGNGEHGFGFTDNMDGSTVSGNVASNNGANGFYFGAGSDNVVSNNTASGNSAHGFVLDQSSDNNTLTGNVAHDNTGGEGFYLAFGPAGNTLTGNTAYNNGDSGFGISSGSNNNVLTGNTAHDNTFGSFFLVFGADGNTLADNTAYNSPSGLFISNSNNTLIGGMHFYNNAQDFQVIGNGTLFDMAGSVFDNPSGNLSDYTNLSLSDTVSSEYSVDHATQPAALPGGRTSFANKFVNISVVSGNVSIDSATWHWLDSELTNTSNESRFELWKYNGTWSKQNATLDTSANTLSLSPADSLSVFAILQNGTVAPPSGGDGGDGGNGGSEDPLSVSVNSTLDGNIVTVTSSGSPVAGANVLVDGLSAGLTNSSGQLMFPGCSDTVVVKAKKSGYQDAQTSATLVACPACTTNDDCPVSMQCAANQCVPVPCACGTVSNHQCVAFQCCSDTDCASGQSCVDHSCKQQNQCTSDSQCAATQFCDIPPGASGGSCKDVPVGACGQVQNHKFVPYGYECGAEPGCPACPSGQNCMNHNCVAAQSDLNCPSTGVVGASASCTATNCANCDYEITDPSGKKSTGKTDASGKMNIPLGMEGTYTITLLKDGQVVKTLQVKALPKTTGGEEPPPTGTGSDAMGIILLLVLLLLVVLGILWWRSRSGKK